MDDYIDRQKAIDLIAEKQRALCPPGRWGRSQVYGSDRDKYDSLDEAMDQLENIPAADVAPVVHGTPQKVNRPESEVIYKEVKTESGKVLYERHVFLDNKNWVEYCSKCGKRLCSRFTNYCPNCGAKMDGETTP